MKKSVLIGQFYFIHEDTGPLSPTKGKPISDTNRQRLRIKFP